MKTASLKLILVLGLLMSGHFAEATLITFEGLPDSTAITNQYSGLTFENAVILTAGESLNEIDFPPHSGSNVIGDSIGPIRLSFDSDKVGFSGYFTYTTKLTLSFYENNALVQTVNSGFVSNYSSSGLGLPNELLRSADGLIFSSIIIGGDPLGSSFVLDDLSYSSGVASPVPEPATYITILVGFILLSRKRIVKLFSAQKGRKSRQLAIGLLIGACAWSGSAAAQTILAPTVSPSNVAVGQSPQIRITATINAPGIITRSVNVQQLNNDGSVSAVLGTLLDDGLNEDMVAGDSVYTGLVVLPPQQEGFIKLRVSAAQTGQIRRIFSPVATIAIVPPGIATTALPPDPSQFVLDPTTNTTISGNETLVCFKPEVVPSVAANVGNAIGASVIGKFENGNCYQFLLAGPPNAAAVRVAIAFFMTRPEVISAQEDQIVDLSQIVFGDICATFGVFPTCTDKAYSILKVKDAHLLGLAGAGVIVAVLDTGVRVDNIDINYPLINPPRIIVGHNHTVSPANRIIDDSNGHGSHVTGIVSATAPKSRILAIKICSPCSDVSIKAGVDEAVALGGVRVINLSLQNMTPHPGPNGSVGLAGDAIQNAIAHNINVIAAAGNFKLTAPNYPASFPGVIGVGSVDASSDKRSSFSNHGAWVKISAPGSVNEGGVSSNGITTGTTALIPGTSQATPFVAGAAALLWGAYNYFSAVNIRDQLLGSALRISTDTLTSGANQDLGAGRLDPVAALGAIRLYHNGRTPLVPYSFTLQDSGNAALISDSDILGANIESCELRTANYCTKNYSTYGRLRVGSYSVTLRLPASTSDSDAYNFSYTLQITEPRMVFTGVRFNAAASFSADKRSASGSVLNFGGNVHFVTFDLSKF